MSWFSKKPDHFTEFLEYLIEQWQMKTRFASAFLSAYRKEISAIHEGTLKLIEDSVELSVHEKRLEASAPEMRDMALVVQAWKGYLLDLRRGKHVGTDVEVAIWAILCNKPDLFESVDKPLAGYVTKNQKTEFPNLFEDVFTCNSTMQPQVYFDKGVELEKKKKTGQGYSTMRSAGLRHLLNLPMHGTCLALPTTQLTKLPKPLKLSSRPS